LSPPTSLTNDLHLTTYAYRPMDKKAKKRIEVLRKKISELQPRLAGAKKQTDEPDEVRKLEDELAAAKAEVAKLQQS